MAKLTLCSIIVLVYVQICFAKITEITVNTKSATQSFDHFWKSTGFCPPDPKKNIYKYILNNEQKINYALIGSLPYGGILQIRIHWLLNLISINEDGTFKFKYLDRLIKYLMHYNLKPGFEIMGTLQTTKNTDHTILYNKQFWTQLVFEIANRYIGLYGVEEVSSWRFETWNEPDLPSYNILNFTLSTYLSYVNGCAHGLKKAFPEEKSVRLGGPAGLFRQDGHHPLCWGLIEVCSSNSTKSQCPIQFISFHRKGDGTAEGVLNGTLELLDLLYNQFPNLIKMPIANDESDIIKRWSDSWEWLGDVRYAAMIIKVIFDHYKSLTIDRKLKIEVFSNDNAFLNYHPFYFTQRTLFARFQMNRTYPPHSQFIKKPVYIAMGLLALMGDKYLPAEMISSDQGFWTVLATKTMHDNQSSVAVAVAYADRDRVNIETIKTVTLRINHLSIGSRFVVYLLDNVATNPYRTWQDHGRPAFPSPILRKILRHAEGPLRIRGPMSTRQENLTVALNLTMPSIILIHICSKPSRTPGAVVKLAILNITHNEVLLTWSDSAINTKCIRTYEVEFESQCANTVQFQRINQEDVIFLSYHLAVTGDDPCEMTTGRYRVRAIDYWDQPGSYSKIISYP